MPPPMTDNRVVGDALFCQRCGGATESRAVEGKPRPVCVACGFVTYLDPKLAVAVLIERDGMLLLGRRGPNTASPGGWSFPAGFVERGEQVEDAAVREVREEAGLAVTLGPLLGLHSAAGQPVVLAVYVAERAEGEPSPDDDLTELGWFAPDDLPQLAFPHDLEIVAAWQARRRGGG